MTNRLRIAPVLRALSTALVLLLAPGCQRDELPPVTPDTTAPLPPAGLVVESSHDGFVFLGWLKNTEADFLQYIISRAEDPRGVFVPIDSTTRSYYVDSRRSYDTTYFYRVTAVDQSGNVSSPSIIVSAKSPNLSSPDTPAEVEVSGHNAEGRRFMRVTWVPVDVHDLRGYAVYRSDSPDTPPDAHPALRFTESVFIDDTTAREIGTPYFYRVVAVDMGDKTSSASDISSDRITALPELVFPEDQAVIKGYPEFRWRSVPGVVSYRLSIGSSPRAGDLWSSSVDDNGASEYTLPYFGPSLYAARGYYWHVSTFTKRNGAPNAESPSRLFQVY